MWRNADVLDFIGWLRAHNEALTARQPQAGFYGLDLYSMHASIQAVLEYLDKVDPEGARRARQRYACFENFGEDPQEYGYAAGLGLSDTCESEVIEQLIDLQRRAADYARRDGRIAADDFFYAEQNARLVRNAEEYYRAMFGDASHPGICAIGTWPRRWTRWPNTSAQYDKRAKIVLWAHNSHLGDARATEMGRHGELNVGQLVRERYGNECVLIGFTTYSGTVTAASNWGGQAERKRVRPALVGSYEALFHAVGAPRFLLKLRDHGPVSHGLAQPMLERAIGVIYLPESELASHYFHASLARQFDAVLHFDETRAVEPLERTSEWTAGEPAETFPSGM